MLDELILAVSGVLFTTPHFSASAAATFAPQRETPRKGRIFMNKFCTSCGAALEEGQQFCGKCGKPVQGSETTEAQGAYSAQPTQTNTADSNRKMTLVLLCILLGEFGAHCFYAGKKKRAIMELAIWAAGFIICIVSVTMMANPDTTRMSLYDAMNYTGGVWGKIVYLSYVFFALGAAFLIIDLIHILQDKFDNGIDNVPAFMNAVSTKTNPGHSAQAGTTESKAVNVWLTKQRIIFIAVLIGLMIVSGLDSSRFFFADR